MKAYIVEDHEAMRFILKRLIRKNFPSIQSFAESENGEKALEEIPSFEPDLVLVDISLPGMDGLEFIRRVRPTRHALSILVITGHELDLYRDSALQAGADDIVSKNDDAQLLESIRTLLRRREQECEQGGGAGG